MKVCKNCGNILPDDKKFCTQCGTILESDGLDEFMVDETVESGEYGYEDDYEPGEGRGFNKKVLLSVAACLLVVVLAGGIFAFTSRHSDADDKKDTGHSLFGQEDDNVANQDLDNKDLPAPQVTPAPQQPQVDPTQGQQSVQPTAPQQNTKQTPQQKTNTTTDNKKKTDTTTDNKKKTDTTTDNKKKTDSTSEEKQEEKKQEEKKAEPTVEEINEDAHEGYAKFASNIVDTSETNPANRDGGYVSMTFTDTNNDDIDEAVAVSVDDNESTMTIELLTYDQKKSTVKVADSKEIDLDRGMSPEAYDNFYSSYDVFTKENGGDTYLCVANEQTGEDEVLAATKVYKLEGGNIEDDVDAESRQILSTDQVNTTINNQPGPSAGDAMPESGAFDLSTIPDTASYAGAEADEEFEENFDDEDFDYDTEDYEDEEYIEEDEDSEDEDMYHDDDLVDNPPQLNQSEEASNAIYDSIDQINAELDHTGLSITDSDGNVGTVEYGLNSDNTTHICTLAHDVSESDVEFQINDYTSLSAN